MTPTAGGDIRRHPGTVLKSVILVETLENINYATFYEHLIRDLQDLARQVECLKKTAFRVCQTSWVMEGQLGEKHSHLIEYFDSQRVNL